MAFHGTPNSTQHEIVNLFTRILQTLKSTTIPNWLGLELSMAQLKSLLVLSDRGELSIGQLSDLLGIGIAAGGHLVDRLTQAGLVIRTEDPNDRRRTLAMVSPAGDDLVRRLRSAGFDVIHAWLEQLSTDESASLLIGLQALARAAGTRSKPSDLVAAERHAP